ncbi:MAG TPA: MFS transporter [Stenomitos sp.]
MIRLINPDAFQSLQVRDFRLYWIGNTLSKLGGEMTTVALAWQVYLLTHQPLSLGLIGLIKAGPVLLFSIFGGVLADSMDRRKLLLMTQTVLMTFSLILAGLALSGHAQIWMLYVIILCTATASSIDGPTHSAVIPSLVPRGMMTNAITLNNLSWSVAGVLGPALGGLIIGWQGVGTAYLVDAASFLAVIIALSLVSPAQTLPELSAEDKTPAATLQRLKEGFGFLRRESVILALMLLDFFAMLFGASLLLLPVFAKDILQVGPQGLGLLSSAPALGAIVGAAGLTMVRRPRHPGRVVLMTIMVYGLATAVFGVSRQLWLSWLMLATTGVADTLSMTMRQSIRQLLTPDEMRGRIGGVNYFFAVSGTQLGEFEAGVVAQFMGAGPAVMLGGLACMVMVALVGVLNPGIRRFEEAAV